MVNSATTNSLGDEDMRITKLLPILKIVYDNMRRLSFIIINIINQLHSCYFNKDKFFKQTFKTYSLYTPLETLSKALSIIYNISLIIKENSYIKEDWTKFKKGLKIIFTDPPKFGTTDQQMRKLDKILGRYDKTLFASNCFLGAINQSFDLKADTNTTSACSVKLIKDNSELYDLFTSYFKQEIDSILDLLESNMATNEVRDLQNVYCLYALYRKLFPNEDRNLWKKFWSLQKKCPAIILSSNLIFSVSEFMNEMVPLNRKAQSKDPKDSEAFIRSYIENKDESFEKEISTFFAQFCGWAAKMDSSITKSSSLVNEDSYAKVFIFKNKQIMNG